MLHLGLEIQEAVNGFIVTECASWHANLCGEVRVYVFNNISQATTFISEHFAKELPQSTFDLGAQAGGTYFRDSDKIDPQNLMKKDRGY
jgi:hypothetical protein